MYPSLAILLVEDDVRVAMIMEDALSADGFAVLTAPDGDAALQIMEANEGAIGALVSDIRLPGSRDGWEVARQVRRIRPDMPVVYMSGDSAHGWRAHGVPDSVMLQKPFVTGRLIAALSTLGATKGGTA